VTWALYAGLVLLNIIDVVTTRMAMVRGAREMNPLMTWFAQTTPRLLLAKALVLAFLAFVLWQAPREVRTGLMAVLAMGFVFLIYAVGMTMNVWSLLRWHW